MRALGATLTTHSAAHEPGVGVMLTLFQCVDSMGRRRVPLHRKSLCSSRHVLCLTLFTRWEISKLRLRECQDADGRLCKRRMYDELKWQGLT